VSDKHHLEKVEDAKRAIDKVHSDTSVDKDVTEDSLKEIRDHVDILIESLES
jgi:hypothetical protein